MFLIVLVKYNFLAKNKIIVLSNRILSGMKASAPFNTTSCRLSVHTTQFELDTYCHVWCVWRRMYTSVKNKNIYQFILFALNINFFVQFCVLYYKIYLLYIVKQT